MKRDEQGIWSVTIGPLEPALYSYIYLVDEVVVLDPLNPEGWIGREGPAGSLVNIRAASPRDDEIQAVPRGVRNISSYTSSTGLGTRSVEIYLPPGYDEDARINFPVLYLLHGSGDTESAWMSIGRAGIIADNLIAAGRARPMIIVMPSGHVTPPNTPDLADLRKSFNEDLVKDLIPLIDSQYRTVRNRQGRAIAGISMGAFQALWFALDRPDLVSRLGIFGGGIFGPEGAADIDRFAARQDLNKNSFEVFRIRVGDRDMNRGLSKRLDEKLTEHEIAHQHDLVPGAGHTWPFWRECLIELLPTLFRPAR
jgi:enterochelin esterase family protein